MPTDTGWTYVDDLVPRFVWSAGADDILAAVSTRAGGVSPPPYDTLNLGRSTGDDEAHVDANRDRFVTALGASGLALARVHQVHGDRILDVTPGCRPDGPRPEADGLVTQERGWLLVITVADCMPVFVAHAQSGTLALVHAGWRGTAAGIAARAVERVARAAGVAPRSLRAALGPAIGPCCYEVGADVAARFPPETVGTPEGDGRSARPHLDLAAANALHLRAAGLAPEAINAAGLCTACRADLFFSHRRDHGLTGRMIAVFGRR